MVDCYTGSTSSRLQGICRDGTMLCTGDALGELGVYGPWWPGCIGVSINNRTWISVVQPDFYVNPLHCDISCSNNGDCPPGENCDSGTCVLD